jgi:beta-N-acetylhexosaminidase
MRWYGAILVAAALAGAVLPGRPADAAAPVVDPYGLSLEQQVGQLLMVGVPATGPDAAARRQLARVPVGAVILTGRGRGGVAATARVTARLQSEAAIPLLVAADQEGGAVQALSGPGFDPIPSALAQGRAGTGTLRQQARTWGHQLRLAGVQVDLAPVADTVPAGAANPPIGGHDRQFGSRPEAVATHAGAVARGLQDAGVLPTVKHFPGLGRVPADTDTRGGVTDPATSRTDPYLSPFRYAVRVGTPFVMMSNAVYAKIDAARPAVFSPVVIDGLLRGDLGFDGVVVSDDLGAARQVSGVAAGDRATRFVAAGGDLVLTVDPATLPVMYAALLARARADAGFRLRVERSAQRILLAKQRLGLVGRPVPGRVPGHVRYAFGPLG